MYTCVVHTTYNVYFNIVYVSGIRIRLRSDTRWAYAQPECPSISEPRSEAERATWGPPRRAERSEARGGA